MDLFKSIQETSEKINDEIESKLRRMIVENTGITETNPHKLVLLLESYGYEVVIYKRKFTDDKIYKLTRNGKDIAYFREIWDFDKNKLMFTVTVTDIKKCEEQ